MELISSDQPVWLLQFSVYTYSSIPLDSLVSTCGVTGPQLLQMINSVSPPKKGNTKVALITTMCRFHFPEHAQHRPSGEAETWRRGPPGARFWPAVERPFHWVRKSSSHYPSPRSRRVQPRPGAREPTALVPAGVSPRSGDRLHIMSSRERVPGPAIESSSDAGRSRRPTVAGESGFCCTAPRSRRFCRQ